MSSLALAEGGHLSATPLNAGNLRFRMEPRLRAAGQRLRWDMHPLPDTADGSLCLPGTVALPLLRVLQEALANAVKHAMAQTLSVRLAVESSVLVLEISNDGVGFDLHQHALGKGLAGMQKRARSLGAELDVHSGAQGTQVRLQLPLVPGVWKTPQ